jgi:uncharacterized membrane protein YidH (DUF202 family)
VTQHPLWKRLTAEFLVIVLGVLVALAADRWNQDRSGAELDAAYVERFTAEIRADSIRAEDYLRRLPSTLAARDTLLAFVNGSPPPQNLTATILRAVEEMRLYPPNAWTEIQASRSLTLIRNREAREAISAYYGTRRANHLLNRERADRRGRDPLIDAAYQTGVFDLAGLSSDVRIRDWVEPEVRPAVPAEETFRAWPRMQELLIAVGSGHFFQRVVAENVILDTGAALSAIAGHND